MSSNSFDFDLDPMIFDTQTWPRYGEDVSVW